MPDRLLVDLGESDQVQVLSWPDGGLPEEVSQASLTWPLDADALEDLRWYLEDYLLAPYGVWGERGPAIREKLAGWGEQVFESVFGDGPARFAYERARNQGVELIFRSAAPSLLGLPWELMRDGTGPVARGKGGISRSLPVADGAGTLEVPGGKLRVLMVISRPAGTSDVGYQIVARPLLERLDAVSGEVSLTVLRPPTFDALREAVRRAAEAGEPFHVVHFDGHGAMPVRLVGGWPGSAGAVGGRPPMMTGPGEAVLAFEKPGSGSDQVGASKVAAVLAEGRVPVVVLNACQSGAVGKELEASIATALLKAGCAAVVAMAYSVYAVAAAEFMAAFYESLFKGESVGQAVTAGRKRLFEHDGRPSPKGDLPLADWLVPVHYMRREVRFPQARITRPPTASSLDERLDQIRSALPEAATMQVPLSPVDGVFVGRDDLFYQLENAARSQRVLVLTGPGGTGKTELAKGFARWWRDTGGVDDPRLVFWHSFEPGVASFGLDGLVTEIGLDVFGVDFARLDPAQRLAAVKQLLVQQRALLVWDNFESIREMPDPAGATKPLGEAASGVLREFLDWVRDRSASTVLIISRAQEIWLGQVRRIAIGGLNRAEAARYAGHLLAPYPAAQPRRDRPSFGDLLDWLDGHPLAMRLTLPRLDTTDAADLLDALRGTTPLLAADTPDADRTTSLAASISYSYAHLSDHTRRLLPAVTLFRGTASVIFLALFGIADKAPGSSVAKEAFGRFAGVSGQEWSAVLTDAARVGLLTDIGAGVYQIHPALPGYLVAAWRAEDPAGYEREREASEQALCAVCAGFSLLARVEIGSGDAGGAYSMIERHRRTFGAMLGYALDRGAWEDVRRIVSALDEYWDTRGLGTEADAWADRILAATGDNGQASAGPADRLWLHATLAQATRQKDSGHPDRAEQAYRRALAYLNGQPATGEHRQNVAHVYHQLGMCAGLRGQLDEAEDWYRRSLAISEEVGNRSGMASTFNQLGINAQMRGRLHRAEDWYRKALDIDEKVGDRHGLARVYHQLGRIAEDRGQFAEAENRYRRSLAIAEELGDHPSMVRTLNSLGDTARARGLLAEAEDWYRRSLAISEELGDRPAMAHTYFQLGRLAQMRGRPAEADGWWRRSFAISEELGDWFGLALGYGKLGALAEGRMQLHQALDWTIRCLMTLLEKSPRHATEAGLSQLARLTHRLGGVPALEEAWRQVAGQAVPQAVRDYVASNHDQQTATAGEAMTDPAADAARSAAAILAADLGSGLSAEVEAALAARGAQQRPDRYLDPVSLGSLTVSVATLAWTIYNDQRNRAKDQEPEVDSIARQVRVTLRDQDMSLPTGTDRITEVVATEVIRHAQQRQE